MGLENCKKVSIFCWKLFAFESSNSIEIHIKKLENYLVPQGRLKDSANNRSPR